HWRAYGFWAPPLEPYEKMAIMDRLYTKRGRQLMAVLDPYQYRDRITNPKYMINASGDEFFLPDSSQFYYGDLKGEKHLRYIPNDDHSLPRSADARETVASFFQSFVEGQNRPEVSWRYEADGLTIRVKTS